MMAALTTIAVTWAIGTVAIFVIGLIAFGPRHPREWASLLEVAFGWPWFAFSFACALVFGVEGASTAGREDGR